MPKSIDDLMSKALQAHRKDNFDVAYRLYSKVLRDSPRHVPALYLLGVLHLQRGNVSEASRLLGAAASANPPSADVFSNYGVALAMSGEYSRALAALDRAVALDPRHADALINRGNALYKLHRNEEALASFDRALAVDPNNPETHSNRGIALGELGRYEDALASYQRALRLDPSHVKALENRGNALNWLNRYEAALASYRQALALTSGSADLHYALGFAQLRRGDCREGFAEYEWRLKQTELVPYHHDLKQPRWVGDATLAGKTIMLHCEQGFGDTIQFARYVPLVAGMGASVVLEAQPTLRPLLTTLPGGATIISRGENLPPFDCHCPLPSLPLAFATEIATIPAEVPYLSAPAERIDAWRERIPQARRRVGIVWCGNPNFRNDRQRSMVLAQVAPVLATPDTAFVSLNPDIGPDGVAALASMPNVTHLATDFRDFADTAAVLAELDLVVTSDTAIAHLAGAMAKPVWILLATNADWRWLIGRDDSPWYPTARLFRQPRFGDWESVVARVADELSRFEPVA